MFEVSSTEEGFVKYAIDLIDASVIYLKSGINVSAFVSSVAHVHPLLSPQSPRFLKTANCLLTTQCLNGI